MYKSWPDIGAFAVLMVLAHDDGVVDSAVTHLAGTTGLSASKWRACLDRFQKLGLIEETTLVGYHHTTPRYRIIGFERPKPERMDIDQWRELSAFVFLRDDYTCAYCGERGGILECDHVIPFSRGGTEKLENLVTACKTCNRAKRARTPGEWRRTTNAG
jgi:5-methylcytosine-specific restriction endonuclease McrA